MVQLLDAISTEEIGFDVFNPGVRIDF